MKPIGRDDASIRRYLPVVVISSYMLPYFYSMYYSFLMRNIPIFSRVQTITIVNCMLF